MTLRLIALTIGEAVRGFLAFAYATTIVLTIAGGLIFLAQG